MDASQKIDIVFADANDFEICSALTSAIEDHYGFDTLLKNNSSIPHDRWAIHSVLGNTGFFACEGYSRLWSTQTDHHGFAKALAEIGFPILSSLVEKAIGIVPSYILGDYDLVEAHTSSEAARDKASEHLDTKIIFENPNIQDRLASYIRIRRASYTDLVGTIDEHVQRGRKYQEAEQGADGNSEEAV